MMRMALGIVCFVLVVGCSSVPESASMSYSPSKRYVIDFESSDSEPNQRLIVRDRSTERVVIDYPIERNASVVWSPSEQRAVVVDNNNVPTNWINPLSSSTMGP
jgi:hypothetical protein